MNKNFDLKLKQIKHFNFHPQMLPFVGENYEQNRILLVTESHFLLKGISAITPFEWYSSNNFSDRVVGNTRTRDVIDNHFNNDIKSHSLFKNIQSAMDLTSSKMKLQDIAWYNFFQRPALFGQSIKNEEKDFIQIDIIKAQETFKEIIDVLKPSKIIFLSKFAFDSLQKDIHKNIIRFYDKEMQAHCFSNIKIPIYPCAHPNSPAWNSKIYKSNEPTVKITGKQLFINILEKNI